MIKEDNVYNELFEHTNFVAKIVQTKTFKADYANGLMRSLLSAIEQEIGSVGQEDEIHGGLVYNRRYLNGNLDDKIDWLYSDLCYYADRWCHWRLQVIKLAWDDIRGELLIREMAGIK